MKHGFTLGLVLLVLLVPVNSTGQQVKLLPGADLNFGEVIMPNAASGGFFDIDAQSMAGTASNAYQIGTYNVGNFSVEGKPNSPIILTAVAGPLVCDTTYINPCLGTPSITIENTFTGILLDDGSAICRNLRRCTQAVRVGGRFTFGPSLEGRWTSIVSVVANFQ